MELELAIKTVRKFNQENRYRDCGKINNSIDMVLQELEELQQKEKGRIIGNINEIKVEDLKPILKPYYIPKEKVRAGIESIENYFDRLNGPDEDIDFIREIKQELLEE